MVKKNHTVKFQVVEAYTHMGNTFQIGRVIEARHYRDLVSWVRAGLKLIEYTG